MKKYCNPLRLTTYLLLLFCFGHTKGALVSMPRFGSESDAVATAMQTVHFTAQGADCTWYGFYLGFGYFVSIFFLLSAALTWFLGGLELRQQRAWSPIVWALFLCYAGDTYLSWRYFFIAPLVFSTAITALLGVQCLRLLRPVAAPTTAVA
jgi:hypothetical protein